MAIKVKPEEVIRHEEVYSVGLDVSQRSTSICVLDPNGKLLMEGQARTNPFEIARYLQKRMEGPLKLAMQTGSLRINGDHILVPVPDETLAFDTIYQPWGPSSVPDLPSGSARRPPRMAALRSMPTSAPAWQASSRRRCHAKPCPD